MFLFWRNTSCSESEFIITWKSPVDRVVLSQKVFVAAYSNVYTQRGISDQISMAPSRKVLRFVPWPNSRIQGVSNKAGSEYLAGRFNH